MSAESTRQPPFYCPACGKKHRADLSALRDQAGAAAKVTCARCESVMTLRVGPDGLPKCESNEPIGGPMSQPDVKKPGLLVPIAAAAVVAAAVSFGLVSALKPAPAAAPRDDARLEALEAQVRQLTTSLEASEARAKDAVGELAELTRKLEGRVNGAEQTVAALGKSVATIEQGAAKVNAAFVSIQKDHEDHAGRIEANRVTGRQLAKRVEALEGK